MRKAVKGIKQGNPFGWFIPCILLSASAFASDPYAVSRSTWGQAYADQWGMRHIGLDADVAERARSADKRPVVAVIDTGLDYFHIDFPRDNVWRNAGEQPNGKDDDGNGYVDDLIGWNFIDGDNNPWDWTGHGTHVAGVIAAASGNGEGIASVNPQAIIMPLKAMNLGGRGYSTRITQAIYYAVDHGADIINLSMAVAERSPLEAAAIAYAVEKDVLVVAAAGNEGRDVAAFGPASFPSVLTVAATDTQDNRASFSNFGKAVDIAAPGEDILSLRAARTDFVRIMATPGYRWGENFVGEHADYYRASGTSFAAPFVSGAAALLLSANPQLSAAQLSRMLKNSARDIDIPGIDQNTGYGLLNIAAALAADPDYFIDAAVDGVEVIQSGDSLAVRVLGTVDADRLARARIFIAPGTADSASQWQEAAAARADRMVSGALFELDATQFAGAAQWTLRLVVEHQDGTQRQARFILNLG